MALSVLTNRDSLNALEKLQTTENFQTQTITRLSSGYRINRAGDDPAGLALANEHRQSTAGLNQGVLDVSVMGPWPRRMWRPRRSWLR